MLVQRPSAYLGEGREMLAQMRCREMLAQMRCREMLAQMRCREMLAQMWCREMLAQMRCREMLGQMRCREMFAQMRCRAYVHLTSAFHPCRVSRVRRRAHPDEMMCVILVTLHAFCWVHPCLAMLRLTRKQMHVHMCHATADA
jgi:hypothetical protein